VDSSAVKQPLELREASVIGKSPPRKEGVAKVTGKAVYVDDLPVAGAIYGATVRSKVARGHLRGITYHPGVPWEDFHIVTAADIPGENTIALIEKDQQCLVDTTVNHPEEAVVLIAHPDRELVERARRLVELHIEPLPMVFDLDESLEGEVRVWGEDNLLKQFSIDKGDIASALASAPIIIEGEYATGAQEQLYIEPQGMVALASPKHGITVWGSLQCPYYVHKALATLFGLPKERVRIIQCETGGGFGGKEEYPSMIAAHAALLAWKARRPVKLIYDRHEDMLATTKRHPSRTRIRSGHDAERQAAGTRCRLSARRRRVHDAVAGRAVTRWAACLGSILTAINIRIRARAAATNHPPHGAFRGFGAPQSVFAIERHLDKVAAQLGIDGAELRRRNFLVHRVRRWRPGRWFATTSICRSSSTVRWRCRAMPAKARPSFPGSMPRQSRKERRSVVALGWRALCTGAGFTGSGERYLASVVAVDATPAGIVRIRASSTEIGQGKDTVFTQIAQDALGLPSSMIEIIRPDTAEVPDSGPTVASRTVMIVGKLVHNACLELRRKLSEGGLLGESYTAEEFAAACGIFHQLGGPLRVESQYQRPAGIEWDDKKYRGDAYATYAWAVYIAEVTVDLTTYETRVDRFYALQDAGRIIHPVLAAGQIEGGVAQGVGMALYEKVVWKDGRMQNAQMTNYIMPTSLDVPDIFVEFDDRATRLGANQPHGPRGAKGIGELPLDGSAPAVASAVHHATGAPIDAVPMTPEDLMLAMETVR
jgi:CO/xanthine dehydrogenase Mo-binding subunit